MSREKPVMIPDHAYVLSRILKGLLFLVLLACATLARAQAAAPEIAFLGDSITAGYGLEPGEAFPELIGKMLEESGQPITVVNAGVSGDTTSGGLARLDWSIPETVSAVVLELGANDALRGIPVEQAKQNLEEIITRIKGRDIEILLLGMRAPPNMGSDYEAEFNAIFPELAGKHDLLFYEFVLEGVAADPALNQSDAMHPNREGSEIIAKNLLPMMQQLLARLQ